MEAGRNWTWYKTRQFTCYFGGENIIHYSMVFSQWEKKNRPQFFFQLENHPQCPRSPLVEENCLAKAVTKCSGARGGTVDMCGLQVHVVWLCVSNIID